MIRPSIVRAVFLRHLRSNLSIGHRWVDSLVLPLLELLLWGFFATFVARFGPSGVPTSLVAAVLFWGLMIHFHEGMGLAFQEEFGTRNVINVLTSPMAFGEYLAGVIAWGLVRVLAGWTLSAAVAIVVFDAPAARLAMAVPAMALLLIPLAVALSLWVLGVILRFGDGAGQLNWYLGAILVPLSAVYYPAASLPAWARLPSLLLPSTHAFEVLRGVFASGAIDRTHLLAGLAGDAVALSAAALFVRQSVGTWRRKGFASRYL